MRPLSIKIRKKRFRFQLDVALSISLRRCACIRIMAITSAFQADDAGSIPAARSRSSTCLVFLNKTISVHRIMAITSAFQADDAGSIPAARSNALLHLNLFHLIDFHQLCSNLLQSHMRLISLYLHLFAL